MAKSNMDVVDVIIHCSASGPKTTAKDIKRWHIDRGFNTIGYHIVIEYSGSIKAGRDCHVEGAHCKGHNHNSLGVCLVGGHDGKELHKFSKKQIQALELVLEGIRITYGKHIDVHGHYEYNKGKTCPCFDVPLFLETGEVKYTV